MAPTWTQDKVQKLLDLLREHHDCLFVKSPTCAQRKLKKETFKIIADKLKMPPQALKYKFFNLSSAYNAELKKIDLAKKKGFFYRPSLPWFNDFRDVMERTKESTAENEQEEFKRAPSQDDSVSEEEMDLEEETDALPETSNADTIVVSIKQEYINGPLKGSRDVDFDEALDSVEVVQEISPMQPTKQSRPAAKRPVKRRHDKKQDADLFQETPAETPVPKDEFQMFANHVAEQLRHMNANSARRMQGEIHIIFDEEGFPFDSPVLEDMK